MPQKSTGPVHARTRRRGRECAAQFLFSIEFTHYEPEDILPKFWEMNSAKPAVRLYAEHLIRGVIEHRSELDDAIDEALQGWTAVRVGHIERNILRVALFEMWYGDNVPDKVAINEAIEVAKRYSGDEAPRFINGVLDRLRKS